MLIWEKLGLERPLRLIRAIYVPLVILGVLLSTMHQSSLGTVMLLAGHKLHGLWNTGWIPLLFLISCVGMGYAVVVWESALSSRIFKRERETSMLASLSGAIVVTLALFLLAALLHDVGKAIDREDHVAAGNNHSTPGRCGGQGLSGPV